LLRYVTRVQRKETASRYKEWSKEKVKTRMTRSKSRKARSRTREEKSVKFFLCLI
ncbi:hypothetical protein T10_12923, partial [Trichinella papuae]